MGLGAAPTPDADRNPDGAAVQRRAPFSDNPRVGARGQRARQRILDAALRVFGEEGYHRCGVIRITEVAGCSRAAFYQYFSSKEDVFRQRAGEVGRQLTASADALGPITPDAAGWQTLRQWVERHGDIYDRYEPVFRAFQAAAESDEAVASGADRIAQRHVAAVRAELTSSSPGTPPPRHVETMIALLLESMTRTRHVAARLVAALPPAAYPRSRVDDAVCDVLHRTLVGLDREVNAHPPAKRRPPRVPMGPVMRQGLAADEPRGDLSPTGERTLAALLDVPELPDGAAGDTLRPWLRRYHRAHAAQAAMIRVWVDATTDDPSLQAESAAALDRGRRRMARFLAPRGFGDPDTDALVMVALLDGFGARPQTPATVGATAQIIERGLLGR